MIMVFAVWTKDIYIQFHMCMCITFGLLMECRLNGFGPFYSTEKYTATAFTKILC